ncbi:hypothetical protein JN535_04740 [Cellulosimicrobium cellulans]|uniref:hypothetical protein n=1 Tax=Cellulosimicrobium cellulans TaxID=1710 RepID=UPI0019655ADA|nr:hypothetical protein [Cellulosimicrobium cellulans]MBN0039482.1 hypothetical protein [Cellulosimicrobium cellulans]
MARILSDKIESIRRRYADKIESIRNDRTRTDEWKTAQLAKVYLNIHSLVEQAQARADATERETLRDAQHRVLGTVGLKGDSASLVISQRDAADRAANIKTADQALHLLGRANATGDQVLARAIAAVALRNEWVEVANAFLAEYPELNDPFNLLWANEHGQPSGLAQEMYLESSVASLRPRELAGMGLFHIQHLANAAEDAA